MRIRANLQAGAYDQKPQVPHQRDPDKRQPQPTNFYVPPSSAGGGGATSSRGRRKASERASPTGEPLEASSHLTSTDDVIRLLSRYEQRGDFLRSWQTRRREADLHIHELAYARQRYQLLAVAYPQNTGYMQECNRIQNLLDKSLCFAPAAMSAIVLNVINNTAMTHHHADQTPTSPPTRTAALNPMHTRPTAPSRAHTTIPRMKPTRNPPEQLDSSDDDVTSHDDQVAALHRQMAEVRKIQQLTLETVTKQLTADANLHAAHAAAREREMQHTRAQAEAATAEAQRQLQELESQRREWQRDRTVNQQELQANAHRVAQLEHALAQAQRDQRRSNQ